MYQPGEQNGALLIWQFMSTYKPANWSIGNKFRYQQGELEGAQAIYFYVPTWQNNLDRLDAGPEGSKVEMEDGVRLHQDARGPILSVQGVDGALIYRCSGVVDT